MKLNCDILERALDNVIEEYIKENDLEKVRHAHWECVNESENVYMCTGKNGCGGEFQLNCGTPTDNDMIFCPYCGAKMDGDSND